MAFWGKWFKKRDTSNLSALLQSMQYSYYGNDIFSSDVVQQAIFAIVSELKKLDPVHIRKSNGIDSMIDDNLQTVLENPNSLMTTSDFIEKVSWNLLVNCNSFIYPMREKGVLTGLYPLQPTSVTFEVDAQENLYLKMNFKNGNEVEIPYDKIIHVRYKYSRDEFLGGNEKGQAGNEALLKTLEINNTLLNGLAKSLKIQTSVNGIVKMKTMKNTEDQIAQIREFEEKIKSNESGFLPLDLMSDFIPFQKQVQLLDATTLEFIDKKILRSFGVSIPIIDGSYTKEEYEAFYQKTLEPIIKNLSEAFTKGLFTKNELAFKNRIVFYPQELIFMNTTQKLELYTLLSNQGGCYINEVRTGFGMRPIPELDNVRMMSLNYVDTKNSDKYQVGDDKNNTDGGTV